MKRLNEIEARADAATEGPWEVGDRYHCQAADMCECAPSHGPLIDTYQDPNWGVMHVHRKDEPWWNSGVLYRKAGEPPREVAFDLAREDAEFIAHARQDVPTIVAALRAVLDLHTERPYGCAVCEEMDQALPWPCPTVTTITTALEEDA